MARLEFHGRILPEICKVTLTHANTISWVDEERHTSYTFRVQISDGKVRIECDAPQYQKSHFDEVYRRCLDLARAAVDVVAFGMGFGLTVVLEKFQDEAGALTDLLCTDPALPPLVTAFRLNSPPPNNLDETLKLVWTQPPLFFALRDLVEAITLPHRSAVCCGRAIEGLRNLMTGSQMPRGQAWGLFRRTLQLEERYLKLITDHSVGARHGDLARISGDVTTEIAKRSWTVMNRYLIYRLRGEQPLLPPEFPMLVG